VNELSLIIDHVSLSVEDLGRAKNFYSRALAPLGMQIGASAFLESWDARQRLPNAFA
jgi:hypothetical protein